MNFEHILSLVPESAREQLERIWEETGGNLTPLQICIAGAFSTGKTTLLNNLLGASIFPVALEETTALPTFVEYSDIPNYELMAVESVTSLQQESIRDVLTNPPDDARLLNVGLPLTWLKGVSIIDLPGTGSVNERNKEYSREQLRQTDAVIYLLPNRGASRDDIGNLTLLHTYGKKVFICVAQWDIVQNAVKLGEPEPNLSEWSSAIAYETGIECTLYPLDRTGLGIDNVLSFIQNARDSLRTIRMQQFYSEALPILNGLLDHCQEAVVMLAADSEEKIRINHSALLQEKQSLYEIRQQAHAQYADESESILSRWDKGCEELTIQLQEGLRDSAEQWTDKEGENAFLERGETLLRDTLAQAAILGQTLSKNYGDLKIPHVELQEIHLHLTLPPALSASDFLDVGRFDLLQSRLQAIQQKIQNEGQKTSIDATQVQEEINDQAEQIEKLEKIRRDVLSKPLPKVLKTESSSSAGKMLGRTVGEIADLALLYVLPAVAAAKVAALFGKAGKAVGMSAKVAKTTADAAKTATEVALNLNRAGQGASQIHSQKCGGAITNVVLDKIGKLEMLTLGYWGERIGTAIDGNPIMSSYTDPAAIRERQETLASIDTELRDRQVRMFDLKKMLENPGSEIAELEAEMATVNEELKSLTDKAEKRKAEIESAQQQEFNSMIGYEKKRCTKEWMHVFSHQCQSMRRLLSQMLHNWWENYLPTLLKDNEVKVNTLIEQMKELPAQRKEREESLRATAQNIQQAIDCLRK